MFCKFSDLPGQWSGMGGIHLTRTESVLQLTAHVDLSGIFVIVGFSETSLGGIPKKTRLGLKIVPRCSVIIVE
jgi:hypothetical protein